MADVSLIASALIEKEGKFLPVNAKVGRPKCLWNLPGGHLNKGETFSAAAAREAKEETGFDVSIDKTLCIVQQNLTDNKSVIVTFKSAITGGSLSLPVDEISEAKWFSFDEVMAISKSKITGTALNSVIAFKKNKQLNYSTEKISA